MMTAPGPAATAGPGRSGSAALLRFPVRGESADGPLREGGREHIVSSRPRPQAGQIASGRGPRDSAGTTARSPGAAKH